MSYALQPLIWKIRQKFLTSTEKLVLLKLADFAQDDGSSVYPSSQRLAIETELSLRTVQRTLDILLDKKVITLVEAFNARKPNRYIINIGMLKILTETNKIGDDMVTPQGCHGVTSNAHKIEDRDDTVSYQGCHAVTPESDKTAVRDDMVTPQGRHDDRSGVTQCRFRGDMVTPNPLYKPLIKSLTLLPDSVNQASVAIAPSSYLEETSSPEKIQESQSALVTVNTKSSKKIQLEQLERDFSQWYALYPRKESRKKALPAFKRAMRTISLAKLLELTQAYAKSVADKELQFLPYPATWLNQERWDDVDKAVVSMPATASSSQALRSAPPSAFDGFLSKHIQVDKNWFTDAELVEQNDELVISHPSRFLLDKISIFSWDLEKFFGRRICFANRALA